MKKKLLTLSICLSMVFLNVLVVNAIEDKIPNNNEISTEENEVKQKNEEFDLKSKETNNSQIPVDEELIDLVDSQKPSDEGINDSQKPVEEVPEQTILSYSSHIQNLGWQKYVDSPGLSGTEGKALRLEALRIKLESNKYTGGVSYSTHIQNIGWQNFISNNGVSGTEGRSLRLEAIKIKLTGEIAEHYDIYYRCHVQTKGWLGWTSNGEVAGTEGLAYRMEAVEVKLVSKDELNKPDTSKSGFYRCLNNNELTYKGHIQDIGNIPSVVNNQVLGTAGRSLRMEQLVINLDNSNKNTSEGGIQYRAHIQDYGWTDYVNGGSPVGTSGQSKRLEAVSIRLTGDLSKDYNIYYRCHVQHYGWLGWAMNGQNSGTSGSSYRLEAIQIAIIPKADRTLPNSNYFYSGKNGWYYEGGYKLYYQNNNLVTDTSNICDRSGGFLTKVNRTTNTVTVYARDGHNGYIVPVKAFTCSVGLNGATPKGTFRTTNKYRWHTLMGPSYGQYCTRIVGGILFHSVAGYNRTSYNLKASDYNKLGQAASHGCVRLCVRDAKWIFDNCASGMTVQIYDSAYPGPFGKPATIKIPAKQNWDPTDPAIR